MARLAAALLTCSFALCSGCAPTLRQPVSPGCPRGTRPPPPWRLERELLMPDNARIQIVVELVDGNPPEREALDDLARLAARYGERPASWVFAGAPGAPP